MQSHNQKLLFSFKMKIGFISYSSLERHYIAKDVNLYVRKNIWLHMSQGYLQKSAVTAPTFTLSLWITSYKSRGKFSKGHFEWKSNGLWLVFKRIFIVLKFLQPQNSSTSSVFNFKFLQPENFHLQISISHFNFKFQLQISSISKLKHQCHT